VDHVGLLSRGKLLLQGEWEAIRRRLKQITAEILAGSPRKGRERSREISRKCSLQPQDLCKITARPSIEIRPEQAADRKTVFRINESALIELAQELGFRVNSPLNPSRRGGTVSIQPPDAKRLSQELVRRRFLVDYRPGAGIRVAPHFYNTIEEVEATVEEMSRIATEMVA